MPREITDRGRVVEAVQNLALTAELFEEENGKQKHGNDLEVIVQGRDYGNGKSVGPYIKLLNYDAGEEIMRQGEWGGNTFYIAVEGALDVYLREAGGQRKIGQLEPGTCFGEMALLAGVVYAAISGHIRRHRAGVIGLYSGSLVTAGLFALLPGRLLGKMVWGALGLL